MLRNGHRAYPDEFYEEVDKLVVGDNKQTSPSELTDVIQSVYTQIPRKVITSYIYLARCHGTCLYHFPNKKANVAKTAASVAVRAPTTPEIEKVVGDWMDKGMHFDELTAHFKTEIADLTKENDLLRAEVKRLHEKEQGSLSYRIALMNGEVKEPLR